MNKSFNNNNNNNNNIRVFEECNHCDIVSLRLRKDNKVVASKYGIFDRQNAFSVLKPCRILRRPINLDNNTSSDNNNIEEYKMDPTDKMMMDGNEDADFLSTLQETNNN
jgi:hypothetical protein